MKKLAIFAVVMMIGASAALASTLNVPFFRDAPDLARGTRAFIGVKESSGADQTITIVYTALNISGDPVDQTVTFALGANQSVSWEPVEDGANEGTGQAVPNMTIEGPNGVRFTGSVTITGSGALSARYVEIDETNKSAFGHAVNN